MSGHTPGPWTCESADWPREKGIVRYYVRHDPPEITPLNGRLIAAAPDLLEALKRLEFVHNQYVEVEFAETDAVLVQARQAIAKAEGR